MKHKFSSFIGSLQIALGIFLVSVLLAIGSSAQDCTEASLLQKSGTWKEGMKGSTMGIPADVKNRDRFYAGTKKYYDDKLSGIEKAAKILSPADFQQPAIVPTGGDFAGFLNEGERFAVILVKENPDYYNPKLSKGIPQLFSIVFDVDDKKPVLAQAYAEVMKALDFTVLKNILGKEPEIKPAGKRP